jgi:hypothetical protein
MSASGCCSKRTEQARMLFEEKRTCYSNTSGPSASIRAFARELCATLDCPISTGPALSALFEENRTSSERWHFVCLRPFPREACKDSNLSPSALLRMLHPLSDLDRPGTFRVRRMRASSKARPSFQVRFALWHPVELRLVAPRRLVPERGAAAPGAARCSCAVMARDRWESVVGRPPHRMQPLRAAPHAAPLPHR